MKTEIEKLYDVVAVSIDYNAIAIMANFKSDEGMPYHPLIAQTLRGRGHAPSFVAEANAAHKMAQPP